MKKIKKTSDYSFDYDESKVLYKNDFETDLKGWVARSPKEEHFEIYKYRVGVELTDEEAHGGAKSMKISGRKRSWNGATLNITDYLKAGKRDYEAMAWVKLRSDAAPCHVRLALETIVKLGGVDLAEQHWWDDYDGRNNIMSKYMLPASAAVKYPKGYVTKDGWVLLRGRISILKGDFDSVHVYIETSDSEDANTYGGANTNDIYVDDFTLLLGS